MNRIVYTDGEREFLVCGVISRGLFWGTFCRAANGPLKRTLKRIKSRRLPDRHSFTFAQQDLDAWAKWKGLARRESAAPG